MIRSASFSQAKGARSSSFRKEQSELATFFAKMYQYAQKRLKRRFNGIYVKTTYAGCPKISWTNALSPECGVTSK